MSGALFLMDGSELSGTQREAAATGLRSRGAQVSETQDDGMMVAFVPTERGEGLHEAFQTADSAIGSQLHLRSLSFLDTPKLQVPALAARITAQSTMPDIVGLASSNDSIRQILDSANSMNARRSSVVDGDRDGETSNGASDQGSHEEARDDAARAGDSSVAQSSDAHASAVPALPDSPAALLKALQAPDCLWGFVREREREAAAFNDLMGYSGTRTNLARAITWAQSPDFALLQSLPSESRESLAFAALARRWKITQSDWIASDAAANSKLQQAQLAYQAVEAAKEAVNHMRTWRSIARWAPIMLCVTTALALFVAIVVALKVDNIADDGLSLAVTIFALAVFSVSPAVLLLTERPLKGVDSWAPSGISEKGKSEGRAEEAGSAKEGGSKENDKSIGSAKT